LSGGRKGRPAPPPRGRISYKRGGRSLISPESLIAGTEKGGRDEQILGRKKGGCTREPGRFSRLWPPSRRKRGGVPPGEGKEDVPTVVRKKKKETAKPALHSGERRAKGTSRRRLRGKAPLCTKSRKHWPCKKGYPRLSAL